MGWRPPLATAWVSGCRRSLGRLGRSRKVLVVVLIFLVVLAVVPVAELNRPDIAGTEAEPPQLVRSGAYGLVPSIDRLPGLEERDMPIPRPTVIPVGGEPWIARAVGGLEGNGTAGRIADQVGAERGDGASTIGTSPCSP
jgi:hypothetical protein